MKLGEIYDLLASGEMKVPNSYGTIAALERAARQEGVAIGSLGLEAPRFALRYPRLAMPATLRMPANAYSKWRRTILDVQMQARPSDTDADEWASLRRAARVSGYDGVADDLGALALQMPAGIRPRDVTTDVLLQASLKADAHTAHFRKGVRAFLRVSGMPLPTATGLMPPVTPEMPPAPNYHAGHAPLSPGLKRLRDEMEGGLGYACALDYVNRLAIAGGLLNGVNDTTADLASALSQLPDPAAVGVPVRRVSTIQSYCKAIRLAFRHGDHDLAWIKLRRAAREAGLAYDLIYHLAGPARAAGLAPRDITPAFAEGILAATARRQQSYVRRGCEQFDGLIGRISGVCMPPVPIGIRRLPKRASVRIRPEPDQIGAAWKSLNATIQSLARKAGDASPPDITYVRPRAVAARLLPEHVSQAWVDQLAGLADRSGQTRLRKTIRDLMCARERGVRLPALQEPADRRLTAGILPSYLQSDLSDLCDEMGSSQSGRRAMRVAVAALTDLSGSPSQLSDLLAIDLNDFEWGGHSDQGKTYTTTLRRMARWIDLPWTQSWRNLQRSISRAGVSHASTPIPVLLPHAAVAGLEPQELTLDWARSVDRNLRSTIFHPPLGRADLALTFARHLSVLDGLHAIADVVASGYLPVRIGDIRQPVFIRTGVLDCPK